MLTKTVKLKNNFAIVTKLSGEKYWAYYRVYGSVKVFKSVEHANNYGKKLNLNHITHE